VDAITTRDEIRNYAERLINKKANDLVGSAGINASDVDDVKQELWLHVLSSIQKYDGDKASAFTFIRQIIDRRANNILRDLLREKRSRKREEYSLEEGVLDGDGRATFRKNTISSTKGSLYPPRLNEYELVELSSDVADVIARLPEEQRKICQLLKTGTVARAAKILGIPRTSVHVQINKIRTVFERHGLEEYFNFYVIPNSHGEQ
jgi:RNA polymerase sigma factor (sigma-70 family)